MRTQKRHLSRKLFIMFVVIDLYGVQERLHAEKRTVRQTLSRELFQVRFIGILHTMQRRVQIEKRSLRSRFRHFLSGRYAAVCRRVLLHRGIKGKIGNFRSFSGVPD